MIIFGITLCLDEKVRFLIKKINTQYNFIFRDNSFIFKIVEASFIVVNEALTLFIIYSLIENILKLYKINSLMKIIIFLTAFFIIHYLIGIVLLFYNNLKGKSSDGKTLTGDFLISYFLIAAAMFFIILFYKETVRTFALCFVMADVASYFLNVKLIVMFLIMGRRRAEDNIYHNSFFVILVSAMIILFMLIMNLFIGVVVVDGVDPSSFSSCPGVFDLFYYTMVTFATIGFGDIVPISNAAKGMAVLISGSSIFCLSVFLGSIYSMRSK